MIENFGIDQTRHQLETCLSKHLGVAVDIIDLRRLTGGASQEQYVFRLVRRDGQATGMTPELVLRREPEEAICATYREREFQLLKAAHRLVPAPIPYVVDADGDIFGRPAMICSFVTGVQKPSSGSGNVSGIGIDFGPKLREQLAPQFVAHLAKIHTADVASQDFSAFDAPTVGSTDGTERLINSLARLWHEDQLEHIPLLSVAERWLRRNMPTLDYLSPVHGDYRSGNFLFDEASGMMTAILDWELGYLGDRHADLAWVVFEPFGCRAEDGEVLCCGLMKRDAFLDAYQAASGLSVDPERLRYFTILNLWKAILFSIGSGPRAVNGGKSHQDLVLIWLAGIGYPLLESMRRELEGALHHGA